MSATGAIAGTPAPPYYAVIFTSIRADQDHARYAATAARMIELARAQPGFLGVESARDEVGLTVSYWRDEAAIRAWKQEAEHLIAQSEGRRGWYERYAVRVARVTRAYGFEV